MLNWWSTPLSACFIISVLLFFLMLHVLYQIGLSNVFPICMFSLATVCWALKATTDLAFKKESFIEQCKHTHANVHARMQHSISKESWKWCSQFVITNAGAQAEKQDCSVLWLLCAPGEETCGTACFQHASPHYHPHSSEARQTMALNIHGNPLSSKGPPSLTHLNICNKSASACANFWMREIQQNRIPMLIPYILF